MEWFGQLSHSTKLLQKIVGIRLRELYKLGHVISTPDQLFEVILDIWQNISDQPQISCSKLFLIFGRIYSWNTLETTISPFRKKFLHAFGSMENLTKIFCQERQFYFAKQDNLIDGRHFLRILLAWQIVADTKVFTILILTYQSLVVIIVIGYIYHEHRIVYIQPPVVHIILLWLMNLYSYFFFFFNDDYFSVCVL